MSDFFSCTPEEFHEVFESLLDIEDNLSDMVDTIILPTIGDCILYNKVSEEIYIRKLLEIEKEQESQVIGIVVNTDYDNRTVDCIMKNFLSNTVIDVPLFTKYNRHATYQTIGAYFHQMFERYVSKFQRASNMDFILHLHYYVPNIALMDYLWKNRQIILSTIQQIYDENKVELFSNRFFNGVFTTYKNKFYVWKPVKNGKREIKSMTDIFSCEFLGWTTLTL